jgi:carbon-monoxide dehydrogenase medium subunit
VKPAPFRYHAPTTIEAAVAMLAAVAPEDGRILAGGQSLVPIMAFRLTRPTHLVDINGIAALRTLIAADGVLRIGAGVRHAAFYRATAEGPLGRLLSTVVHHIAHHPIRTRGTFCGSLAHADPASEWCLAAATLDAQMVAVSTRGTRTIGASDYFRGIMTTALAEDEILMEARLPLLASGTRFGFQEFSRRAGDFALGMVLVTYRVVDGIIAQARVGIGATEPAPRRIVAAEAALNGRRPEAAVFEAASAAAAAAVEPLEDSITSAEYRRDLVRGLTRRALESAATQAATDLGKAVI